MNEVLERIGPGELGLFVFFKFRRKVLQGTFHQKKDLAQEYE